MRLYVRISPDFYCCVVFVIFYFNNNSLQLLFAPAEWCLMNAFPHVQKYAPASEKKLMTVTIHVCHHVAALMECT